jgi:hypothetical protein
VLQILLFLLFFTVQTPTPFDQQTEPAALIGSYYNAITLKDYTRAYNYWEQAPGGRTEAQFAAGFADTAGAQAVIRLPIFTDAGAGNLFASIPTLVIAERNDGSTAYFAGCFTAHKTNVPEGNATEPDPNWYIREGTLRAQTALDLTALDTACEETESLTEPVNTTISQLDPVALIQSYFMELLTGSTASTFWQGTLGDLFAAQYNLAGAADVQLYVNPEILVEGAAGSAYAGIPALTVFTDADGNANYVVGCYTARRSSVPVGNATEPDPNWYFEDATLISAADAAAAVAQLAQVCLPAEG